jgi:nucleoid-associated protein YgaU
MAEDKKKSIFDKAIDALTDRDEKEAAAKAAAEKAAQEKANAERVEREKAARTQAAVAAHDAAVKAAAEKTAAEKAATQYAAGEKARLDAIAAEQRRNAEMVEQRAAAEKARLAAEAAAVKFIAEHHVAPGETLSHLALKYYGNAAKPYYMAIYEANKALIGDNPNVIRAGTTLKIPQKPQV